MRTKQCAKSSMKLDKCSMTKMCSSRSTRYAADAPCSRTDSRRFLPQPKHIEVQILGDQYGNVVHLFERDCTVQRRHQKIIEFAPALSLSTSSRQKLHEAALKIARHVKYRTSHLLVAYYCHTLTRTRKCRHRGVPCSRRRNILHRSESSHVGVAQFSHGI